VELLSYLDTPLSCGTIQLSGYSPLLCRNYSVIWILAPLCCGTIELYGYSPFCGTIELSRYSLVELLGYLWILPSLVELLSYGILIYS